jgi:hypothetical protein
MSIWSQLESDSKRERDLLNRAMTMLHVLAASPITEKYMRYKINALEREIMAYMEQDHKHRANCVPFDITEIPPNTVMSGMESASNPPIADGNSKNDEKKEGGR